MLSEDKLNTDDERSMKRKERSWAKSDNDIRDNVISVKFKYYNKLDDMNNDLKKILRMSESLFSYRMPQEDQIDMSKMFESQKELVVKTIVPAIKQLLNPDVYLISKNIIHEILHKRHRSQCNVYRISRKLENERKKQSKRKHSKQNGQRKDKEERR
ncbi:hypothetical protein RclHR1_21850004 [Rhizophagus clarus]|nr:hypothetical protein RclHR1_21850004 [Rhizophagus clarus]